MTERDTNDAPENRTEEQSASQTTEPVVEGGDSGNGSSPNGGGITKGDLRGVFLRYLFWFQSGWNYERFQAPGYAHSMSPVLKKLYPDKEERKEALETHLEFFNTMPFMAAPILGANIALEEQTKGPIPKETVTGLKTGMMGPFAGIGDSFFLAIYNSILFSIGSYIALDGSVLGPLLVFVFSFFPFLAFRYWTFMEGYKQGTQLVARMAGGALRRLTDGAAMLGLAVVGGLIPTIINTQFAYVFTSGEVEINIQEQLDSILPAAVPVAIVAVSYWLLRRRVSPTVLIFILLIGSIALSALGILQFPEG